MCATGERLPIQESAAVIVSTTRVIQIQESACVMVDWWTVMICVTGGRNRMSDQCKMCVLRGNWEKCHDTECHRHENWIDIEREKRISQLEKQRDEALKLAETRKCCGNCRVYGVSCDPYGADSGRKDALCACDDWEAE